MRKAIVEHVGQSLVSLLEWSRLVCVNDKNLMSTFLLSSSAIETIESAVFISTGTLYELAETEVILCEEDCEMCAGGWPQNAFDYVMDNNGIPLLSDMQYDSSTLLALSNAKSGDSEDIDEDGLKEYLQDFCPTGGGSGSGDKNNGGDSGGNDRFGGEIKGYGYATEKCVCYTDGTGCDCEEQNEGMAVRNIATYGPGVVCFDASTWQDYEGGIITSESGCSSGFMDVNHCAQVVGYAYTDGEDEEGEEGEGSQDNKSGSGDRKSGSKDDGQRTGYWIVRNQWSEYWGMNGYAYVAMGDNTCGVLNDILLAYT